MKFVFRLHPFFFWSDPSLLGSRIKKVVITCRRRANGGCLGPAVSFITWHWSPRPPRSPFAPPAFAGSWAGSRRSDPFSADPHRHRLDPDWDYFYSVMSARASHRSPAALAPCYSATSCADFETRSSPANPINPLPACNEKSQTSGMFKRKKHSSFLTEFYSVFIIFYLYIMTICMPR